MYHSLCDLRGDKCDLNIGPLRSYYSMWNHIHVSEPVSSRSEDNYTCSGCGGQNSNMVPKISTTWYTYTFFQLLRLPVFEFGLCYFSSVWLWQMYLTCLILSFLICICTSLMRGTWGEGEEICPIYPSFIHEWLCPRLSRVLLQPLITEQLNSEVKWLAGDRGKWNRHGRSPFSLNIHRAATW